MKQSTKPKSYYPKLSRKQAEMIIDMYKRGVDFGDTSWPLRAMEVLEMQPDGESFSILTSERIGGDVMKRDMELVRRILLTVEAKVDLEPEILSYEDVEELVLARHIWALYDAGFIMGLKRDNSALDCPQIMVEDLTWDGHDFLAVLKNEAVWEQIKDKLSVEAFASAPLPVIRDVGTQILKAWMLRKLGLSGS